MKYRYSHFFLIMLCCTHWGCELPMATPFIAGEGNLYVGGSTPDTGAPDLEDTQASDDTFETDTAFEDSGVEDDSADTATEDDSTETTQD